MSKWSGIPSVNATRLIAGSTGWRTCSTRTTFRRVWCLRNRIGVTRLADLTELDRVGLPVASAVRPLVNSAQITAAQGKGMTGLQACVSALMEAAERWAASQTFAGDICTVEQLDRASRRYVAPHLLGGSLPLGAPAEWIDARHLSDGSTVLVPASDVFFPYFAPQHCVRPSRPSTSGLASGNILSEAILHGLFEVVERAVTSSAWQRGCPRLVPHAQLLGTPEGELLRRLELAGARTIVCQVVNALIPVYSVFTFDNEWLGPRIIIGGQGAHLSARVALQRALAEAAQSRIVALQGSREDLARHSVNWDASDERGRSNFEELHDLVAANGPGLAPSEQRELKPPATIEEALALTCDRLAVEGYRDILFVDLTAPLHHLFVARVLVPGLIDQVVKGTV